MNTTFNTQALAYSVSGTVRSGQTERTDTEQVFKKLDVVKKDGANAPDAQARAAVVSISNEGAQRSEAAQAASTTGGSPAAATAAPAPAPSTSASASSASAAPAPAPAPQAASGTATGTSTGGVSSSTQTYDPADANRDGKVTDPERQAYDTKIAAQKAADKAAEQAAQAARSAEAGAALKAYASVEQLGKNSGPAA